MRITSIISLIFIAFSTLKGQPLKPDFSAVDLYNSITLNPALKENFGGEPFAWHGTHNGDLFVKAYQVWKDTSWLNLGIKYYEFLQSHMHTGPDGYIGLIGPNFRENGLWNNEVISDALVANLMLEFSELVLNDASLKKIYIKKANKYIAFCEKHMIEKWDRRNLWHETGEFGGYLFGADFVKPNDFSKWVNPERTKDEPLMSIQYNIANCLGITNLRLYRITGKKLYRDKAEKLFFRLKSNMQYFDDHYLWNYWSPYYEQDIDFEHNTCRHWVNVHRYRPGYQAIEVAQVAEAYHTGLVFDSTDIQRIINTNLDVMWNKSREHPDFIMSNGKHPDTSDRNGENAVAGTGILWSSLHDFSQVIIELERRENDSRPPSKDIEGRIQQAYFNRIVATRRPGFMRRHNLGRPVIVKKVPFGNSPDMNYTGVIPYIIKRGQNAFLVAKSRVTGDMEIDLYSRDGKTKIRTIHRSLIKGDSDGLRGFLIIKWDGIDPEGKMTFKGDYLVRWTLNGKYSNCAIKIL